LSAVESRGEHHDSGRAVADPFLTADQIHRMQDKAIVGDIGHFDGETDIAGLAKIPGFGVRLSWVGSALLVAVFVIRADVVRPARTVPRAQAQLVAGPSVPVVRSCGLGPRDLLRSARAYRPRLKGGVRVGLRARPFEVPGPETVTGGRLLQAHIQPSRPALTAGQPCVRAWCKTRSTHHRGAGDGSEAATAQIRRWWQRC
jgi:S-adenosyl-L-homocysteine hydrolase, NAD binding domain